MRWKCYRCSLRLHFAILSRCSRNVSSHPAVSSHPSSWYFPKSVHPVLLTLARCRVCMGAQCTPLCYLYTYISKKNNTKLFWWSQTLIQSSPRHPPIAEQLYNSQARISYLSTTKKFQKYGFLKTNGFFFIESNFPKRKITGTKSKSRSLGYRQS